ncbi:polyprenyl synthetase family protein [Halanaeroarchaeum sulfurireducens]|uniref:Multifunctional long-chain (E)-prenyl diphosphate synthase n=1 Tax=Halanaeroarchaeum sulfurireducens TaxID=1604004 RepID=A0A0F7PAQ8_9EURY|nr:polyprenyl synthetase family protein [Halanaeroarchaeum sulfurireducens]AKH96709.1 multifunctional long-chain (E)-prenyl diphosphate synthase [Halanaeroarchaeum sulfurireducens]ALG81111.1 multifunctional long-chain (E)-prenyl diphosphate synthase [Halanaeroarchaeum sulfurireducens]
MEYVEARRDAVEERLQEVVERVDTPRLREELEHVVLAGGKRVRPTLTILACEAGGGDMWATDAGPKKPLQVGADGDLALDFAVGVELAHSASLVVDDIIDRSTLRRGTESAWARYGHGPAIVASDGLLGEAFHLFSADPRALESVSRALVELGEGEATELVDQPATEAEYMELARRKTGALFRTAAELGAIAADANGPTIDAFGEYAERVGIAFQIRDDVLDAVSDAEALGKPAGHDDQMERPSIVRVTGQSPETLTEQAREESRKALAALDSIDMDDGQARTYLEDLAIFVVERER